MVENVLKHKIVQHDDKDYLLGGTFLFLINEDEIGSTPSAIKQYTLELPILTHKQLYQIAHPEVLDDNQHNLMHLHCKVNHGYVQPFIQMADGGYIKRTWTSKMIAYSSACPAFWLSPSTALDKQR